MSAPALLVLIPSWLPTSVRTESRAPMTSSDRVQGDAPRDLVVAATGERVSA
jgi:hypothetical protein